MSAYPGAYQRATVYQQLSPRLALERADGEDIFCLGEPFKARIMVDGKWFPIIAPAGMKTDLASVPWFIKWFVGRVGPHLEAAILHDWLHIAWEEEGREPNVCDFEFANDVMEAALRRSRLRLVQRVFVMARVRSLIGWRAFKKKQRWA